MAQNELKTNEFEAMRSVWRRPITFAVFRRALRHHGALPRPSTPSSTPTARPTPAEGASAENRRMATAALCGRVRASGGIPAGLASVGGPDRRRGPLVRYRECPGARLGGQSSSFSPKSLFLWLFRVAPRQSLLLREWNWRAWLS